MSRASNKACAKSSLRFLEGLVEALLDQRLLALVDALVDAERHRIQLAADEAALDQDGLKQLDENVEHRAGQWLADQMAIGLRQPLRRSSEVGHVVRSRSELLAERI